MRVFLQAIRANPVRFAARKGEKPGYTSGDFCAIIITVHFTCAALFDFVQDNQLIIVRRQPRDDIGR